MGKVVYTQMLNARGGVETDVTVQRRSGDAYLVVTGTGQLVRDKVRGGALCSSSSRIPTPGRSGPSQFFTATRWLDR